jgi:hypothetical protein
MPRPSGSKFRLDPEDVEYHWTGGQNVTWRLTHLPTGISVEGSSHLSAGSFTKERLREYDDHLPGELLSKLERLVKKRLRSPSAEWESQKD